MMISAHQTTDPTNLHLPKLLSQPELRRFKGFETGTGKRKKLCLSFMNEEEEEEGDGTIVISRKNEVNQLMWTLI